MSEKMKMFEDLLYSIGFINNDILFKFNYKNSVYEIFTYKDHISLYKNYIVTIYKNNDFIDETTKYVKSEFVIILRKRKIDKLLIIK